MLTDSEIAVIEPLIQPARDRVADLKSKTGFFGWLLASPEHQAYKAASDLLDTALAQYATSKASPDDQHEEALQIVDSLKDIATPGWAESQAATVSGAVQAAGEKASGTIGGWLARAGDSLGLGGVATWIKVAIIVIGLIAVAYILGILRPLLPRKRHA